VALGQMGPAARSYPLGVRDPNSTPWRLLTGLQTVLWAVLALCLGNAWGSRTPDSVGLHLVETEILSELAEDQRFYFNARFYDAERGAFIGRDPKLQFWSPYSYVGNGPLDGLDPTGEEYEITLDSRCLDLAPGLSDQAHIRSASGMYYSPRIDASGAKTWSIDFTYSWEGEGIESVALPGPGTLPKLGVKVIQETGGAAAAWALENLGIDPSMIPFGIAGKGLRNSGVAGGHAPKLPEKNIASDGKISVEHYYKSGDHAPAHAHVVGGGTTTKIGPNGKPIAGSPELTAAQRAFVITNKSSIRRAVNKIGRWLSFGGN